ncbi:rhodanese [Prevotella sp. P5-126]|uniref:rhodanese-like domain-containing protein n=1 Tax=unclassified Prevotella TaxID=2638335 RepID=UPI000B976F7E|nr:MULTISPECIES: rhodanese-like domain-containing protein [unclassified Prevotella]OYP35302.1 rhodanese [Prevotella sp. P5-126]OYP44637.1 rhodanese [Prevotella sp. P4-119]OYP46622.1 rhodanese [Prevotella sp. P4-98]OYP73566.1 rhodanese [Prevotella sp. P4-67]
MKKIIALLLGLLGLTTNASAQSDSIKTVDAAQFAEFIKSDSVFLVDVRTAEEYAAGHIPNAKNVDVLKSDFKDRVETLSKNKEIAVYCRSGKRSLMAANTLAKMGYKVINLRGGWKEWQQFIQKK